ncbi:MAG TPA: chorismate synthase [Spirochaetota bacterium]|nr:chorismate synthase [Spirochaetota bacterium]
MAETTTPETGLSKTVFLEWYKKDIAQKNELYSTFADIIINTGKKNPADLARQTEQLLSEELAVRCTAANTYGKIIRLTTFGESHGPALGAVLDGLPAGINIRENDIQTELDRRRPGQSSITSPRREKDKIHILSGVFNGKTTGTPIALIIYNKDSDSAKYEPIKDLFRPGHADFTFWQKFFNRDYRGGGRSSGRETAARVAGGAIAKKILRQRGVSFYAHTIAIENITAGKIDYEQIEKNEIRCADADAAAEMIKAVAQARAEKDSVGGIVQLEIHGLPAGLGDPVFAKLDARLTQAIMTIGAVKAVEIGQGFAISKMRGSKANDNIRKEGFLSNNAGGLLGGITTGQPLIMRAAVKPTPSVARQQQTIDRYNRNSMISVAGRHDPCIVPRIIPVMETMAALVVLDAWEIQKKLHPGSLAENNNKV